MILTDLRDFQSVFLNLFDEFSIDEFLIDKFLIDKFSTRSIFNFDQCFLSFHDLVQISLFSILIWFTCEVIMFKIRFIWDKCFFFIFIPLNKIFVEYFILIFKRIEYWNANVNWLIFDHFHCAKSVFLHFSMYTTFNRWNIRFYL